MTTVTSTTSKPPRPRAWPVVGHLPDLVQGGLDCVTRYQGRLGDLFEIDAGTQKVVLMNHPQHAQHVLVDRAPNYVKQGSFWSSARSLIGLGLPTIEGEVWRQRRRMMNPQFRRARIHELGQLMAATIDEQLEQWPSDGQVTDIGKLVSRVTMAVIVRTMFGTGLDANEADQVSRAMSFSLEHMLQKVVTDVLPTWVPVPGRRAHEQAVKEIDEVLYGLIERRRGAPSNSGDLLSLMLQMRDDSGGGLSDQELRDEAMSLFIAGYETTASAVSWGIARMAQEPKLFAYVADEVDRQLGKRTPTPDDVPTLAATTRYFHEALRMDGPVFFLPRVAVEDDVVDEHLVSAGTMVSLMIDRIHRHPSAWDEPDVFDPDRFLPQRSAGRHPAAWIPFGAGHRQCIGKSFALMEGVLLLSMAAQRFTFEPTEPSLPAQQLGITRRPKGGVPLVLSRR